MSAEGGNRAVIAALMANLGIAVTKFVAFFLTGVSSMLAEAIHSVADSGNQLLLLRGGKRAQKGATPEHPFGYGRERYVYSFIVSIVLFSLGGLFALYEAWHKYHEVHAAHGHPADSILDSRWWWVPPLVLGVAIVLEGMSFRTAIGEARKIKGGATFAQFIRRAKQPELPVILLEDFAALIGLGLALVAVVLALLTQNLYFDVAGTALIGVLLVVVAVVLATETKSLLLGESASLPAQQRITDALAGTPGVERIIHMKTMHLGPEELLVAAKIGVRSGATSVEVADAIDAAEVAIREAEATAQVIYLEPDIYRSDYVPAERPEPPAPAGH
ncbi:cation diffusion facilitator family transporter [Nocardioides panaciterrulae]|uniref:Cation diffusion facilitator family transporter n=1 Tax=Nocardioides panaciterrulae TaxID=661492 RepID=A0A7Y9E473_9ACTN|nr:cation diffusion facilitator family transporter [Nocardioides panaciterrulae]NYD40953.1 cation diffusion facilitator family transporter [Nocardioides panaciterrulae]